MWIEIKNEGFTIASWYIYSDSGNDALVIPRIGESIYLREELYTVKDIIYTIGLSNVSPIEIWIIVEKKNDEDKTSRQYE